LLQQQFGDPASYRADAARRTGDQNGICHVFPPGVLLLRQRLQFGQNGGEKFRNRRMNMHCALDYRVRRLRIHNVQQNVNYFIASGPKNRGTQNLFGFRINRDLDETLCLTFLNGPAYSTHWVFGNECSAPRFPYFGVRHAAPAQGRVYKQTVRLDPIEDMAMIAVEEIVGNDFIVVVRGMCEGAAAVAVAQGPNAGHVGLQLIVNHDVAAVVGGNAGLVQPEVVRVGSTSDG
jgi:hypothetical protein